MAGSCFAIWVACSSENTSSVNCTAAAGDGGIGSCGGGCASVMAILLSMFFFFSLETVFLAVLLFLIGVGDSSLGILRNVG